MKIGEISKKTGLGIDTIRFYEKSGLIKAPLRTEAGYRDYTKEAIAALEFVAHCRSLDIPLAQIKKLLNVRSGSAKSCREADQVIEEHLLKLRERIKELKRLDKSLSELRMVCNGDVNPQNCKIIKNLQDM